VAELRPRTVPDAALIQSRRNPLVRRLRELHQASGRRDQGLLLLEGTHLLQEMVRLGLQPALVLCTPSWQERHHPLLAQLPAPVCLQLASPEVLEAVATTRSPDGVVATLVPPQPTAPPQPQFVLALDRLQDPGNLGTVLRTALAAGIEAVWLADGADPLQPKVLRASAGAALALPLERLDASGFLERLQQARRQGLQLVAALVDAPRAYWQLDWRQPTVVLLGNEGAGLTAAVRELADQPVRIPHSPAVESLNVAVASAPLLLERWRQTLKDSNPHPGA